VFSHGAVVISMGTERGLSLVSNGARGSELEMGLEGEGEVC
jgi:hypothetical protein